MTIVGKGPRLSRIRGVRARKEGEGTQSKTRNPWIASDERGEKLKVVSASRLLQKHQPRIHRRGPFARSPNRSAALRCFNVCFSNGHAGRPVRNTQPAITHLQVPETHLQLPGTNMQVAESDSRPIKTNLLIPESETQPTRTHLQLPETKLPHVETNLQLPESDLPLN